MHTHTKAHLVAVPLDDGQAALDGSLRYRCRRPGAPVTLEFRSRRREPASMPTKRRRRARRAGVGKIASPCARQRLRVRRAADLVTGTDCGLNRRQAGLLKSSRDPLAASVAMGITKRRRSSKPPRCLS